MFNKMLLAVVITFLGIPYVYGAAPQPIVFTPKPEPVCREEVTPAPCCQPKPCCRWVPIIGAEVGSNALYWRPAMEGVQYCTINLNPEPSIPKYVLTRSDWGYDIWGQVTAFSPCFTVAGRYVSFNSNSSDFTEGTNLVPVFDPLFGFIVTEATAKLRDKYRSGDIEFRWALAPCCWLSGEVLGGLRYFDCAQNEDYTYLEAPSIIVPASQALRYQGWGPRLGMRFIFDPFKNRCCPLKFSLAGQVATTAAIGDRRMKVVTSASGNFPQGTLNFPDRRALTPALDWRLELRGQLCICGLFVAAKIGYEMNYYFAGYVRVETTNTLGIVPRSEVLVGFGGPYGGVSIGF